MLSIGLAAQPPPVLPGGAYCLTLGAHDIDRYIDLAPLDSTDLYRLPNFKRARQLVIGKVIIYFLHFTFRQVSEELINSRFLASVAPSQKLIRLSVVGKMPQ